MEAVISHHVEPSNTLIVIGGKYLSNPAFQVLDISTFQNGTIYLIPDGDQTVGDIETI